MLAPWLKAVTLLHLAMATADPATTLQDSEDDAQCLSLLQTGTLIQASGDLDSEPRSPRLGHSKVDHHARIERSSVLARKSIEQMTVVVTGGAGYIGSHAAISLFERGARVVVIDNLSRGRRENLKALTEEAPPGKFKFYAMDLGNETGLAQIFADEKPDAVMHFAGIAYAGESAEDPLRYYHNNTVNTIKLAEAMVNHSVRTLIFSSSCSTYGTPTEMPVTEETPQKPVSPYGWSKLNAEQVLKDFWASESKTSTPFNIVLLRYFNVVGADPKGRVGEYRPAYLVPGSKEYNQQVRISPALFDAAQGVTPKFTVAGDKYDTPDGTAIRDYVHVTDLAEAHVASLESVLDTSVSLPSLRYYNVATGAGNSIMDLVSAVHNVSGVDFTVEIGDARSTDPPAIYADNSKIVKELGWHPKHLDITETMRDSWNFRLKHQPKSLLQERSALPHSEEQFVISDETSLPAATLRLK